jgi:penicillin amidase
MRRWVRRSVLVLVGLLVLVVLAAGGGAGYLTWAVHRPYPTVDGALRVGALHHPARVYRDSYGVPQIYADDPHDLFLVEGYVHAQDRFWQMDADRHITAGTLSELFGADTVGTDKVVRTMGWYRVARAELPLLAPATRGYLQAYSDGVNAYLRDHHGGQLSLEYTLLGFLHSGYAPAAWAPADSDAWLKAMAWSLVENLDDELQRGLLSSTMSRDQIATLYPGYDFGRQQPITGGTGGGGGESDPGEQPALRAVAAAVGTLDGVLGPRGSDIGSNSWVVAGSRTTTGLPLLANDPHLAVQQPSIWYQVGLHCTTVGPACPYDVTGFSFPGMPGVVIGHNARIAWGFTNLGADVADLFLEKVSGGGYQYQGKRLPLATRTETVKVAGGTPVRFTVRATRHGPLLSDVLDDPKRIGARDGEAVALDWTALAPSTTMDALFELDRATGWADFRAAARDFAVPSQNMIYADTAGHIGYQAPGRIPVRHAGDGTYPVPGWTGGYDWTGWVPFDTLPTVYDPPSGYVVTANNAAVGPGYPYLLTKDWGYGYRSQRITDLITGGGKGRGKLDTAAMQRIQGDTVNGNAGTLVPYLLKVHVTGTAATAQRLLRGWDGSQPASSAPAAYFNAVWSHLVRLVFDDRLAAAGAAPSDGGDRWFEVVRHLLSTPDSPWWTNAGRDAELAAALTGAAKELTTSLGDDPTGWQWGRLHRLTLANQTLGTGPAPVRWLLNRGPYPMGGGSAIVDANGWNASTGYDVDWGPSMRLVADLSDLDASRWVNQTGASGHAYDTHYDDQTPLWRAVRTTPWPFTRRAVDKATRHRLTLRP